MGKVAFLSGTGNETTLDGLSRAITSIYRTSGVLQSTDLQVTENTSPDTNVKIAVGSALIGFDGSAPEEKFYFAYLDAAETVAISANSSGNSRIDAVVIYVDTASPGSDDNDGAAVVTTVEGTPAGSPTAPSDGDIQTALGAGVRWLRLANVTVANGFSSIVNANISDTRVRSYIDLGLGALDNEQGLLAEVAAGGGFTSLIKRNSSNQVELGANDLRPTRLVKRTPPTTADIDTTAETTGTVWDVTSITSSRAFAVWVYATINDDAVGSYVGVKPYGTSDFDQLHWVMAATAGKNYKGLLYCELDSQRRLEYIVNDEAGSGPITGAARLSVVAYEEYLD